MKIITVQCTALSNKRKDLVELCKSMIDPSRAEDGCIRYSFYQDLSDENEFFFYEEWKDQEAVDIHNTSSHFLNFQPRFKEMIAEEAKVTVHNVG